MVHGTRAQSQVHGPVVEVWILSWIFVGGQAPAHWFSGYPPVAGDTGEPLVLCQG